MKNFKYLTVWFLLALISEVKSQTVLTNSMVYNFNVNDSFQYHSTGNSCCFNNKLNVITAKNYSLNGDTVIYCISSTLFSRIANAQTMTVQTTITSSTFTEKHFDLNMPFVVPTLTTAGYYQKDTTIFENCNKQTIKSQAFCFSNFECNTRIEKFASGLGHTYSFYYDYQAGIYTQGYLGQLTELIYYHKVGENPCGHFESMITGIKTNNLNTINVNYYPNPTSGNMFIDSDIIVQSIEIADVYGNRFNYSVTDNSFSLNELNDGVYFLNKINNLIIPAKKIIKRD